MFESLAYSPLGFWGVAFLIALFDSIVVLERGEFTFRFERGVKVRIRVVPYPFVLRGKEPVFTLLSYPAHSFLIGSVNSPKQTRKSLRAILLKHKRLMSRLSTLSAISWCGIILIFVCGPLLSLQYDVGHSIVTIWPIAYLLAALILINLWGNREHLLLRPRDLIGIAVELLVCPFLLVNTWKKLAVRQGRTINAESLACHYTDDPASIQLGLASNVAAK